MNILLSAIFALPENLTVSVQTRGFLSWVFIGLLAGWIAGHITRGRGFGCIVDIILGLIGAVIGGWIFTKLGILAWGFWEASRRQPLAR